MTDDLDPPLRDSDVLTLCAFEEANLEPDEGIAAIAKVVLNRVALKYACDGTIQGAVFRHDQFSWTGWAMQGGKYIEIAKTPAQVMARAKTLLLADEAYSKAWTRASTICAQVQAGGFRGALFDLLTPETVLYLNPSIVAKQPAWATPDKAICVIGHHHFYRW